MRHRGLAFLVLTACAGGLAAAPPDPLEIVVLSGLELTLRPESGDEVQFTLPVRSGSSVVFNDLKFATTSVSRGGVPLNPAAVKVERGDPKGPESLVMTVNLKLLAEQGSYSVKIQPLPNDAKAPQPAMLGFTITRPAAELTSASPLRVERVIYFPWCWAESEPTNLVMREKSGKSVVNPGAGEWECELRTADGKPAGRLKLKYPASIPAGGQGVVTFDTTARPALGKTSGELIVRSPQLAPEGYTVPVEVMTRASHVWLVVIILLGIGLGYIGRTLLNAREVRQLAEIAAHERIATLDGQIGGAGVTLKERLVAIRKTILDELDRSGAKPADIEKAAADAAAAAALAVKETEAKLTELRQRITTWKTELGDAPSQPRQIRGVIENALETLSASEAAVKAGDVAKTEEHLAAMNDRVRPIAEAVADRQAEVYLALQAFGNWPESLLPAAKEKVNTALDSAHAKGADWKAALPLTEEAERRLRSGVVKAGINDVLRIADEVRNNQRLRKIKETEPSLADLEAAIAAVKAAQARATPERLDELAGSVRALGRALEAVLEAAIPKHGPGANTPLAGLAEQKYLQALTDVINRPRSAETMLGDPVLPEAWTALTASPQHLPPLESAPPAWGLAIDVSPDPTAGQVVTFRYRITGSDGPNPPPVTVKWLVDETKMAVGNTPFEYTPRSAGRLVVKAVAVGDDGRPQTAEIVIQVRPAAGRDTLAYLHDALGRTVWYKTLIAAVFIPIIGYMLYADAFVGTLRDFMVAFFWGFTVDVGMSKLLELIPTIKPRPGGSPG